MQSGATVLISHAPEDGAVASYLAGDLERQGVRALLRPQDDMQAEQALGGAAALVALISPASAAARFVRADAERASRSGKPIFPVRLADVNGDTLVSVMTRSWTDAYGPAAQGNVARLAQELRGLALPGPAPAPAPGAWGAPPPSHPPPGAPAGAPAYPPPGGAPGYPPPGPGGFPPAGPQGGWGQGPVHWDPEREELLRAYVGPNADLFIAKWKEMDAKGSSVSWSFAGFFLSFAYLLYRKMWLPALGTLLVAMLSVAFFPAALLAFGVYVALGLFVRKLYRAQAEKAVTQVQSMYHDQPTRWQAAAAKGGTSILAVILGIVGSLLAVGAVLFLVYGDELDELWEELFDRPSSYESTYTSTTPLLSETFLIGTWRENCSTTSGPSLRFSTPQMLTISGQVGGSYTFTSSGINLGAGPGGQSVIMRITPTGQSSMTATINGRSRYLTRCPAY